MNLSRSRRPAGTVDRATFHQSVRRQPPISAEGCDLEVLAGRTQDQNAGAVTPFRINLRPGAELVRHRPHLSTRGVETHNARADVNQDLDPAIALDQQNLDWRRRVVG